MRLSLVSLLLLTALVTGCDSINADAAEPLIVGSAGSLAGPLRIALDSFTARTGRPVVIHSAGSVEVARRMVELQDIPDVVALADEDVLNKLLGGAHVVWYAVVARNRMVLAMAPDARHAEAIDSTNWWRVLAANDVEVGRSDPALDPAGYRALMVLRLAGRAHGDTGIERAVLAHSPARDVRPKSADLLALLETGALDYAFVYQSSAAAAKLRFVPLGPGVDLGDEARAAEYAAVRVRIPGATRGDSLDVAGAPIHFVIGQTRAAAHPKGANELANFLISSDGQRILRAAGLDVVPPRIDNERAKRLADSVSRTRGGP